jgi:4'-phosphopantetheinyl transferase
MRGPEASSRDARAGSLWPPGPPEPPPLAAGAVHVWYADLASGEPLEGLLDEPERQRALRLADPRRRALWTRSRGLLRLLLGRYLGQDPRAVAIAVAEHGKPRLAQDGRSPSFNLSHSGASALYAFCAGGAVGVDVELASERPRDEPAIAARTLGPEQARRLRAIVDPGLRQAEFLRAWTRHEAALKCLGTGLAGADMDPADPAAVLDAGTPEPPAAALWVEQLDLGQGAAAALACERPPRELRRWRWSDPLS